MDDNPFGEPVAGEAVRIPDFNPTEGYTPHGEKRFVRTDTGKWRRVDQIQKEERTMAPTAIAERSTAGVMSVYDCIVAVSQEIAQSGIQKNRSNSQQNYKFRGIDDVLNALSPLLAKYRLVILPRIMSRSVVERETRNGGVLFYVTVEAEFDFVSAGDGSIHTVKTYGEAMDSADKATNKAMSAAYKYAAFQTFCIPTEGDNDADAVTHEVKPRPAFVPVSGPNLKPPVAASSNGKTAAFGTANAGSTPAAAAKSDDGPDLGTADLDEMPEGFDLIKDYKLDGDWHQVRWGRDGSDGYLLYKTKLAKVGLMAKAAYEARMPVLLHSKKLPFLDRVEALGMTGQQIAATKFRGDDPDYCAKCGRPMAACECG